MIPLWVTCVPLSHAFAQLPLHSLTPFQRGFSSSHVLPPVLLLCLINLCPPNGKDAPPPGPPPPGPRISQSCIPKLLSCYFPAADMLIRSSD